MWLGDALTSFIFIAAVLLTGKLAIAGVYPLAAGVGFSLLAYGYLALWGDRPLEKRLFSPPHRR